LAQHRLTTRQGFTNRELPNNFGVLLSLTAKASIQ